MNRHDVFATTVDVQVDRGGSNIVHLENATVTANPLNFEEDEDDDKRTVEIEDVLYTDDILVEKTGKPFTESRTTPLTREKPLQSQEPVKDASGNIKTEAVMDDRGRPVYGTSSSTRKFASPPAAAVCNGAADRCGFIMSRDNRRGRQTSHENTLCTSVQACSEELGSAALGVQRNPGRQTQPPHVFSA